MKTLVCIFGYGGANDTLARHWPWFLKSECDLWGFEADESPLALWPKERLVGHTASGSPRIENYPARFLAALVTCLCHPDAADYGAFCFIEYDGIFFKPPPQIGLDEFYTKFSGRRSEGFRASFFVHTPWLIGRSMAERMLKYGRAMLGAGLTEQGMVDRWLGLMMDLYDLPWTDTASGTYSQNTLDRSEWIVAARKAVRDGAWYVHGIKTAAQLEAVTGP